VPHSFSDLAQTSALHCRGSEIDFAGILYCQNMPPRTNWANTLAPSLDQPVNRDTWVCKKSAETNNIAAPPTCQLPQANTFTADHAFKKVRPTPI